MKVADSEIDTTETESRMEVKVVYLMYRAIRMKTKILVTTPGLQLQAHPLTMSVEHNESESSG